MTRYERAIKEMARDYLKLTSLTGVEIGKRYGIDPAHARTIMLTLKVTLKDLL